MTNGTGTYKIQMGLRKKEELTAEIIGKGGGGGGGYGYGGCFSGGSTFVVIVVLFILWKRSREKRK